MCPPYRCSLCTSFTGVRRHRASDQAPALNGGLAAIGNNEAGERGTRAAIMGRKGGGGGGEGGTNFQIVTRGKEVDPLRRTLVEIWMSSA